MNETTLLRDFGPDAPAADPAMLADIRTDLVARFTAEGAVVARPRQRRGRLAVTVGTAAAAVGALTAALVVAGGHAGVNAEASAVLIHAAAGAGNLPTAKPGQYYFESSRLAFAAGESCDNSRSPEVELTHVQRVDDWIPADRTGNGRLAIRQIGSPTFTSPADARHAAAGCPGVLRRYKVDSRATVSVAPVATPYGHPGTGRFQRYDARSLARWPRDPALLYWQLSAGVDDEETLVNATDLLGGGLVLPADLRVAVLRAMSMIPGIEIDRHADAGFGRHGVALTVRNRQGAYRVVLDPHNGLVLALQTVLPNGIVDDSLTKRYGIATSERRTPSHLY